MKKSFIGLFIFFSSHIFSQYSVGIGSNYRLEIFKFLDFDAEALNFKKDNNFISYSVFGSYLTNSKWKFNVALNYIPKSYQVEFEETRKTGQGSSGYYYGNSKTIISNANVKYGIGGLYLRTTREIASKNNNHLSLGIAFQGLMKIYKKETDHYTQTEVISTITYPSGPYQGTHVSWQSKTENTREFTALSLPYFQFIATIPIVYSYNFGNYELEVIQDMGWVFKNYSTIKDQFGEISTPEDEWFITWSIGVNLSYRIENKKILSQMK